MDDLGNIIYVLAMVAAVIFSAIKKQRKIKNNGPVPPVADQPSDDTMREEDIIEDLKELFQPQRQPQKPPTAVAKKKQQALPLYMREKEVVKRKDANRIQQVLDEGGGEGHESAFEFDKEQIDLRRAVIYSEILTRPYQ